jgi:2-dehydro-3-deoxyphosphogluconate aldolase / (4S)-4-hydroxy-2-oxoglutarate aldolase
MSNVLERLAASGVVPVAVIEDVRNAVPTAEALKKGGLDVIEVTLRTDSAQGVIGKIADACPDMLVGAGTVVTLEQCKAAVDSGARFIVSPGFSEPVVKWCVKKEIAITPGCVTPTEIMRALEYGIEVIKYFPAGVYGGLNAMKALHSPFANVRFIPTGGVNAKNLAEYIAAPFIHAVGGSWVCAKSDINAGDFDKITGLCYESKQICISAKKENKE